MAPATPLSGAPVIGSVRVVITPPALRVNSVSVLNVPDESVE